MGESRRINRIRTSRIDFIVNMALILVGGFIVIASFAFNPSTFSYQMVDAGALVIIVAILGLMIYRESRFQTVVASLDIVLGVYTIVAAAVFSGITLKWTGFAAGCVLVAFSTVGLIAHELFAERIVHWMEVGGRETPLDEEVTIDGEHYSVAP
jgi:uncharacterized membrane protein